MYRDNSCTGESSSVLVVYVDCHLYVKHNITRQLLMYHFNSHDLVSCNTNTRIT